MCPIEHDAADSTALADPTNGNLQAYLKLKYASQTSLPGIEGTLSSPTAKSGVALSVKHDVCSAEPSVYPKIDIYVDDTLVSNDMQIFFNTYRYRSAPVALSPGTHKVKILFVNDGPTTGCFPNRNVNIDYVELY